MPDLAPDRSERLSVETYAEVCARLHLTKPTVRALVSRGDLRIVRFGRAVRIRSDDVDRLIDTGGVDVERLAQ